MTLRERGKPEDFIGLAGTLYRENLIFDEPMELRRYNNRLEYTITFRDINSFRNWKKNPQIVKHWHNRFKEQLTKSPSTKEEIDVILEVSEHKGYCTCGKTSFYILLGRAYNYDKELTCNHCLCEVSYAKIPTDIELEEWQVHHKRTYLNWLQSGSLEKQAIKELTNYKKGRLNLQAEEVRKALSDFLMKPVYIHHFEKKAYLGWHSKVCLLCGNEGVSSGLKYPNRICMACNTVFGEEEAGNN